MLICPASKSSPVSEEGKTPDREEERDDLIQFYNKVYVPTMRAFVKKFAPKDENKHGDQKV